MLRLFPPLKLDFKISIITVVSTTLLILERYHSWFGQKVLDRAALYLTIPLLIILLVFRESPRNYGFRLGNWKLGISLTLAACLLITPVLWLTVHAAPSMRSYYAPQLNGPLPVLVTTFFDLIGWEFLFRGWLLFGYLRKFGHDAIWLQAVPFALVHISKPEVETLSTIFGGFIFGWLAWRTDSFLYPFLIHWYIFTLVVLLAGGALG